MIHHTYFTFRLEVGYTTRAKMLRKDLLGTAKQVQFTMLSMLHNKSQDSQKGFAWNDQASTDYQVIHANQANKYIACNNLQVKDFHRQISRNGKMEKDLCRHCFQKHFEILHNYKHTSMFIV